MKTSIALLALSLIPSLSFADNFTCDSSPAEHLHIRVIDNVDAADGTRKAAVLLVTDNNEAFGTRTRVASKTIIQNGAFWTAETNFADQPTGQFIGKFDKTELAKVQVYIPTFNFNEADKDGKEYPGHLFLFATDNTETFSQDIDLSCVYVTKATRD